MSGTVRVDAAANAAMRSVRRTFARCGIVRLPNPERRRAEKQGYHKGYEVRFALESVEEVIELARLLEQAGFLPGRPYAKRSQIILPLYGKKAVYGLLPERAPTPQDASPKHRRTPRITS